MNRGKAVLVCEERLMKETVKTTMPVLCCRGFRRASNDDKFMYICLCQDLKKNMKYMSHEAEFYEQFRV